MTAPDLILFDGTWDEYEELLYKIFTEQISGGELEFRGQRVGCRRHPEAHERWASFWHLVQEGKVEEDRLPDLRRCERLAWVRWVIENGDDHSEIEVWNNTRQSETNTLLWFREEYLVVLAQRSDYWLLRTAYCTTKRRRIEQLRKERDAFYKAGKP